MAAVTCSSFQSLARDTACTFQPRKNEVQSSTSKVTSLFTVPKAGRNQRCRYTGSRDLRQFPARIQQRRRPGHASCSAVRENVGGLLGTDLSFAVVVGRFNDIVTRPLLAGALEAFQRHGVSPENIEVVWVPGSFEIPVVAKAMAGSRRFDAVLCLGAVIRGSTTHYDAVAGAASNGILNAGLATGVPCIMGVLTTENMEQAIDRAGGKLGNKGAEAAITAVEMANTMLLLKERGLASKESC